MKPDRVWYVAYGSNMNEARFLRYLTGDADHRGARDPSPPRAGRWAVAPLRLHFAGESLRWEGGGVAFVDRDAGERSFVRAWDVTADQFEDVFAQESRRVELDLDWAALGQGDLTVGQGWYSRIMRLDLDFATQQQPALTFTWSTPLASRAPAAAYRETIAAGLREHPELASADVAAYLDRATRDQER